MSTPHPIASARFQLALIVSLSALLLTSCGDGRGSVHPVRGQVLWQGKPAEHAVVVFHPVDATGELEHIKPEGRVGADGYFQLRTYGEADGAPKGEYTVVITWPGIDPDFALHSDDSECVPSGPDRLAGRYANPKTSNLQATVHRVNNELEPFVLKHGPSQ